jgi:hypothetical protein
MFDIAKTSFDEIHKKITLHEHDSGIYVSVNFETQTAFVRMFYNNLTWTYHIYNFPFNRILQTISENGLNISVAGDVYETCEIHGVFDHEQYNMVLTSLKIQQQ